MRSGFVATLLGVVLGGSIVAAVFAAEPPSPHHPPTDPHLAGTIAGFIDFTPRGTQPELFYGLQLSGGCANCHGATAQPDRLTDQFPANSWSGSMMANATRDPLFWAALDVANQDGIENGAEGIGDYCLRCHAPDAWFGGRVRKLRDVQPVNGEVPAGDVVAGFDGCLLEGRPDEDFSQHDYGGVGCHFCHRVTPTGPMGEPSFVENGDVWLDDTDCDGQGEPCRAGPYSFPETLPGGLETSPPPHPWKQSAFHGDSAMCGSCHDVTTPMLENGPFRTLLLDNGTLAGQDTGLPYPVERTYSEWQHSDFGTLLFRDDLEAGGEAIPGKRLAVGAQCQDCHMRQAQAPVDAPDPDMQVCTFGPPRNGNLAVHEFVGGNTWVPGILKGEYPGLGPELQAAFDRTTGWATELLTERTALVDTVVTPSGDGLAVAVTVTNLSGHKLPTGYAEGRRMWLEVQVRDSADTLLWSNGAWDPATGALDVDAQTKVYEIKQGIWDAATGTCRTKDAQGREAFHFVLNNCIAKDNRIPPLGFTGAADPEMAAYAYSYPTEAADPTRTVNRDVTQYAVPASALAGAAPGALGVTATLHYQVASREYIEFLRNQAVEKGFAAENALCADNPARPFDVGAQNRSRGQYMYDLWANPAYGRSPPVAVDTATATITP